MSEVTSRELARKYKGFIQDPDALINQIIDNLRDRYQTGFPVIKELIQNADDGRAEKIWLAQTQGLKAAKHPLLQGPSLLVVNDGTFRALDEKGIRRLGLSHRSAELDTIGKFGLGLKSVFHLCEALFFGASEIQGDTRQKNARPPLVDILNPWGDTEDSAAAEYYQRWNDVSEGDQALILQAIAELTGASRWFFLWIPLRQKAHCYSVQGRRRLLSSAFPGDAPDAELRGWWPGLANELLGVLPFLRNVTEIHQASQKDGRFAQQAVLRLEAGSRRSGFRKSLVPGQEAALGGAVVQTDSRSDEEQRHPFAGVEMLSIDPIFESLKASERWPRQNVLHVVGEDNFQQDDKNQPHAAVYIAIRTAERRPRLRIHRATFLPVGDPLLEQPLGAGPSVDIFLHGFFFVDAGRSRVDTNAGGLGLEDIRDERALGRLWNQHLDEVGTLPLLPRALAQICQDAQLSHSTIIRLMDHLTRVELFQQKWASVTAAYSWQCLIGDWSSGAKLAAAGEVSGEVSSTWVLHEGDARQPAYRFAATDLTLVRETFPHLPRFAQEVRSLVPGCQDWHAYRAQEALDKEELALLLRDDPQEHVTELLSQRKKTNSTPQQRLELLRATLGRTTEDHGTRVFVESYLMGICRALMKAMEGTRGRDFHPALTEFLKLLGRDRAWLVRIDESPSLWRVLNALNEVEPGILLVPAGLTERRDFSSTLPAEGVAKILKTIEGPDSPLVVNQLIGLLLEGVSGGREAVLPHVQDLRIVPVFVLPERHKARRVTLNDLMRAKGEDRLFLQSGGFDHKLELLLHDALELKPDTPLMTVQAETARMFLGSEGQPPRCDALAILRMLRAMPPLSRDTPPRLALLTSLLALCEEGDNELRYLIHARRDRFHSDDQLWHQPHGVGHDDRWLEILKAALRYQKAEWSLLPANFADKLPPAYARRLRLEPIEPSRVMSYLLRHPEAARHLGDDQVEYLFLAYSDTGHLGKLPIHHTLGKERVALTERVTYLPAGIEAPAEILEGIRLIEPSENPEILRKQRLIFSELGRLEIIERCLLMDQPEQYMHTVLECLDNEVPSRLAAALTKTPWLKSRDRVAVSPSQLCAISPLQEELESLVTPYWGPNCTPACLPAEVKSHRNAGHLTTLFPNPWAVYQRLATLFMERPEWSLGAILSDLGGSEATIDVICEMPEQLLPPVRFLAKFRVAAKSSDKDDVLTAEHLNKLVFALCREADGERLVGLLQWSASALERARKGQESQRSRGLQALYYGLLREASRTSRFPESLAHMKFPNGEGAWKPASTLCFPEQNVHPGDCLGDKTAEILGHLRNSHKTEVTRGKNAVLDSDSSGLDVVLERYFERWTQHGCAPEVLGGFFSLFAAFDPTLEELAKKYLGSRAIRVVWRGLGIGEGWKVDWKRPGRSVESVSFRIRVQVMHEQKLEVLSLAGCNFLARLKTESESLLAGNIPSPKAPTADHLSWVIVLRRLDPSLLSAGKMQELVWATTAQILRNCHLCNKTSSQHWLLQAEEFWKSQLEQSSQLDIKVAQQRTQDALPVLFRQLNPAQSDKSSELVRELRNHDVLARQLAEVRVQTNHDIKVQSESKLLENQHKIISRIGEFLGGDPATQAMMLRLVRRRIQEHFQYQAASIPFELFQNADDAALDLLEMEQGIAPEHGFEFSIQQSLDRVVFGHNGRAINQFQSSTGREYKAQVCKADLENMLMLHCSGKGPDEAGGPVLQTGKFGLGFKSVFLAADVVQVVSRRLVFEIVGGIYPRLFDAVNSSWVPKTFGYGSFHETLISLGKPKGTERTTAWSDILTRFLPNLDLQLIFSRHIKTVRIVGCDATTQTFRWTPQGHPEIRGLKVGRLPRSKKNALVLDFAEAGKVAFAMDQEGLTALDPGLDRVWVTTPLREPIETDFALGCDFDPDIGRGQLALGVKSNTQKAAQLGAKVGRCLAQLCAKVTEDWSGVRTFLQLPAAVDADGFLASLWTTLNNNTPSVVTKCTDDGSTEELEHPVAVFQKTCLAGLRDCSIIPSGLWSEYRGVLKASEIRLVIEGLLALERVFHSLAPLLHHVGLSSGLIHRSVWEKLSRHRNPGDVQPTRLGLKELLVRLVPQGELPPPTGELLSSYLSWSLVQGQEEQYRSEIPALRGQIGSWKVRSKVGRYLACGEALLSCAPDHAELMGFAPDALIIHSDYTTATLDFLSNWTVPNRECRAGEIAEWILGIDSDDPNRQEAALLYVLSDSDRALGASQNIASRRNHQASWLDECSFADFGFSEEQCARLERKLQAENRMLGLLIREARQPKPDKNQTTPSQRLTRLLQWWHKNKQDKLAEYDKRTYPNRRPCLAWSDMSQGAGEEDWMILLFLAALRKIGRSTEVQHSAFLDLVITQGWLKKLRDVADDKSGFIEILDEYFEGYRNQDFYHWLTALPAFYQLSNWLDEYIAIFLELNKPNSKLKVENILEQNVSKELQGANFRAPNLARTLGIGATFVLRELMRHGTIICDGAKPYGFVASQKVRERFAELLDRNELTVADSMQASKAIYTELRKYGDTLKDPTFDLTFDLPIRTCNDKEFAEFLQ